VEEAIDSDTALISAIIALSSRHAAEKALLDEAACARDKHCKDKQP
jgi:hypothetical protein